MHKLSCRGQQPSSRMGSSGLYCYGCSKCVDDTISLVEGIPWLESMAICLCPRWTIKLKDISCGWPEYRWALPGLLAQDTICMNDYISGSQSRIRKELIRCSPLQRSYNHSRSWDWWWWYLQLISNSIFT